MGIQKSYTRIYGRFTRVEATEATKRQVKSRNLKSTQGVLFYYFALSLEQIFHKFL